MCDFFDKRGYPDRSVVQAGHHHTQQIDWQPALQTSQKENNNRIPFTLRFHPHNRDPDTGRISSLPPLISVKRDKSIAKFLVRSAFQQRVINPELLNEQAHDAKHVLSFATLRNCRDPNDPAISLIILPVHQPMSSTA